MLLLCVVFFIEDITGKLLMSVVLWTVDWKAMIHEQKDKFLENGKEVMKESLGNLAEIILDKIPCLGSNVSKTCVSFGQ